MSQHSPVRLLRKPYLLFVGDTEDSLTAKTAFGLRDWIPDDVMGQWRLTANAVDLKLPEYAPLAARAAGAGSVVVGVAPAGGRLPEHWVESLAEAATAGLDIVSGLHTKLTDLPALIRASAQSGAALNDIRYPPAELTIGSGLKRSGKRLLTVGTDCAIGKKYTALTVARAMKAKGWAADFRATGQTGILIAGSGIAFDTVVADFMAGAAEMLSPSAEPSHWDIVEGQGSLFHPSYAGVALALLHGSQPDALVLCTDLRRQEIDGCRGFPAPDIATAITRNIEAAQLTNPRVQCVGISINTSYLNDAAALDACARVEYRHSVPCADPLRHGVEKFLGRMETI